MDGLVLVRKPVSWTSHDVVRDLRRTLGEKRVGHFGTLDPLASGLLLAAVGRTTRLFPYFAAYPKRYDARVRLGFSTDTYDAEGTPGPTSDRDLPSAEAVAAELRRFEGEIEQLAPPFSAKKHLGKPLYAYARKSEDVARKATRVRVHSIRLRAFDSPIAEVEVVCSSGTYIRSLAHDLGRALGCGAHLAGLVRTAIGPHRLEDARDPDEIRTLRDSGRTDAFLIPPECLLTDLPGFVLDPRQSEDVRNGRLVRPRSSGDGPCGADAGGGSFVRLLDPDGRLLAMAGPGPEPGTWAPVTVFP